MAKYALTFSIVLMSALLAGGLRAADSGADPAARQIEVFYAALIDNMKKGQELGIEGRYRQLQPAAEDIADEPEWDVDQLEQMAFSPPPSAAEPAGS